MKPRPSACTANYKSSQQVCSIIIVRGNHRETTFWRARDYRVGEGHKAKDQRFLGAPPFVEQVKKEVEEEEDPIPEVSLATGVELLASVIRIEPGLLRSSDRSWELSRARTLVIYVLTRRLGYRVKDVADHFRRAPETVSSSNSRFAVCNLHDPTLGRKVERLAENFDRVVRDRRPPDC